MKKIGNFEFPEEQEDMAQWAPSMVHQALHSKVLLVARTRAEGTWACYCVPVPGINHYEERHLWQEQGSKANQKIARAAFPQFDSVPYAE